MPSTVKLTDYEPLRLFLQTATTATLAVPIDDIGTIHAASLLFVHEEIPFRLYFITGKLTEKYTLLRTKDTIPAALVIGTEKGTSFTLQLRGSLSSIDPNVHTEILNNYYTKRGNRGDDIDNPANVLLVFTPSWGRFTDYAKGYDQFQLTV